MYVSPFVGRLDDRGENGMDLVRNVERIYERSDHHVHVLAASIRSLEHLLYSFASGVELATVPARVLLEWARKSMPLPPPDYVFRPAGDTALGSLPYEELDLNQPWEQFDIQHPLTTQGIQKFVADYRSTLNPAA